MKTIKTICIKLLSNGRPNRTLFSGALQPEKKSFWSVVTVNN